MKWLAVESGNWKVFKCTFATTGFIRVIGFLQAIPVEWSIAGCTGVFSWMGSPTKNSQQVYCNHRLFSSVNSSFKYIDIIS